MSQQCYCNVPHCLDSISSLGRCKVIIDFYSIEDIKAANAGVFREGGNSTYIGRWLGIK